MWINVKKFNVTKEQILDGISKTKNVKELCELLGLKYGTLYSRCREYGISLRCYITKWHVDEKRFWELYNLKYSDEKIGKELGIPGKMIFEYRHKHKIPKVEIDDYKLNEDQYQIFIGGMLGDSSMAKRPTENARLTFSHSLKQEEYALWKYNKIKEFCCEPKYYAEYDKRNGKTWTGVCIRTHQNKYFTPFYNRFYYEKDGKNIKYIDKELLASLNELGLAIWFQDDGYRNGSGYYFATNCYSPNDLKIIQDFFLYKYNIETHIHSKHLIYIPSKEASKLTSLIEPYIQPCCRYKLIEGHCKTPLNKETPSK